MSFIDNLLERLPNASPTELTSLRNEYESYLVTLDADVQKQVINRVEPMLKNLMKQSTDRIEQALASHRARFEGHVSA